MTCQVNIAPADEDPRAPFHVAYTPCGAPGYADVQGVRDSYCACRAHAEEAERDGFEVEWPESEEVL